MRTGAKPPSNEACFHMADVVEVHRFCARCWPEESARLGARWDEETRLAMESWHRAPLNPPPTMPGGAAFESVTWHHALTLVRSINRALLPSAPPSEEALAEMARELASGAADREGPMPLEVEMFIQRFGVPEA